MIRLLIADDHAIMRRGLKQLFALTSDIEVAGEAINGGEALEKLAQDNFDVLLMDLTMPGINGIELLTCIRTHHPTQPILVLSMHNELQVVTRAIKEGANGYITKDSEPENLWSAIRKVASGGRFIDPDLAEQLAFESMLPEKLVPHAQLSHRELEIFCLLASGNGVNEIADQLTISNKTVSTHKTRLFEKMKFSSTADLVRYAFQHDLI